jgi:hypothetical protein
MTLRDLIYWFIMIIILQAILNGLV